MAVITMAKFYEQVINACWECPEFYLGVDTSECCKTDKVIDDNRVIQNWCPLPDTKIDSAMQWIPISDKFLGR